MYGAMTPQTHMAGSTMATRRQAICSKDIPISPLPRSTHRKVARPRTTPLRRKEVCSKRSWTAFRKATNRCGS